nr:hypothetical protein [Lacrimispora sp.]
MTVDSKEEKKLAAEFEWLKKISEVSETPEAPPKEFKKILEEMERRCIRPKIRNELKNYHCGDD